MVNEIGAQNLVDLNEALSGHIVNAGLNIGNAGMTNGSRTDSRNSQKNAAEVNAREARENLARRLGNQKEAQDIKKGRVKAPLQDAPKKGL